MSITIAGQIIDESTGAPAGIPVTLTGPLAVATSLNGTPEFSADIHVTSSYDSTFSLSVDIDDATLDELVNDDAIILITLTNNLPGHSSKVFADTFSDAADRAEVLEKINAFTSNLTYEVALDMAGYVNHALQLHIHEPDSFADINTMDVRLYNTLDLPMPLSDLQMAREHASAPRGDERYSFNLITRQEWLNSARWYRFESGGPDDGSKTVFRTPRVDNLVVPDNSDGLIGRLSEFVKKSKIELDVPLTEGNFVIETFVLSLREDRVHFETTVAYEPNSFKVCTVGAEGSFEIILKDLDGRPGSASDATDYFDIDMTSFRVDLLTGTDLDDLPWWVYVLLGLVAPGAAGTVGVIGAIEALLKPTIRTIAKEQILDKLREKIQDTLDEKIDDMLADYAGLVDRDEIVEAMSVQFLSVDITGEETEGEDRNQGLTVQGYYGLWHPLAAWINAGDSCPFMAAAGGPGNRRALSVFREFEALLGRPELESWRSAYEEHRAEISGIIARRPSIALKIVAFGFKHRDVFKPGRFKTMIPGTAADAVAIFEKVRSESKTPELKDLMDQLTRISKTLAVNARSYSGFLHAIKNTPHRTKPSIQPRRPRR